LPPGISLSSLSRELGSSKSSPQNAGWILLLLELAVGFEPTTSPLPRECSTPELREPTTHQK
jgi:hypothetical protein